MTKKLKPAVLCISLDDLMAHSGINPEQPGIYPFALANVPSDAFHFLNRRLADTKDTDGLYYDIAHQLPQILGYATVVSPEGKYLSYSRGSSGGESKLNGQRSIGIGGHTDIADLYLVDGLIDAKTTLELSISRELIEEIGLSSQVELTENLDAIADLTDDVSSVHIGLWVTVIAAPSQVKETAETPDQKWLTAEELLADIDSYEPWSRLIIQQIQQAS